VHRRYMYDLLLVHLYAQIPNPQYQHQKLVFTNAMHTLCNDSLVAVAKLRDPSCGQSWTEW